MTTLRKRLQRYFIMYSKDEHDIDMPGPQSYPAKCWKLIAPGFIKAYTHMNYIYNGISENYINGLK